MTATIMRMKGATIFLKYGRCNWLNHTTWSLDVLMAIRGYLEPMSRGQVV